MECNNQHEVESWLNFLKALSYRFRLLTTISACSINLTEPLRAGHKFSKNTTCKRWESSSLNFASQNPLTQFQLPHSIIRFIKQRTYLKSQKEYTVHRLTMNNSLDRVSVLIWVSVTVNHRERIDDFIDDNKSMIRRMFGNVDSPSDPSIEHFQTFDGKKINHRGKRAANVGGSPHKVDACESTVEIVTPYWASNSQGRIRAIVNTQHLQQAIQQVSGFELESLTTKI